MPRLLIGGTMLLSLAAAAACGSGSSSDGRVAMDAYQNIIIVINSRDADVPANDAPVGSDMSPLPPSSDATMAEVWMSADELFPSCKGTPEQVSDCIINLPTRSAIPVTRADPVVVYPACRP